MTGHLDGADAARLTRGGLAPMSSRDGFELFDIALAEGGATTVTAVLDLAAVRSESATAAVPALLRDLVTRGPRHAAKAAEASGPGLAQRLSALPESEQRQLIITLVREQTSAVLGHGDIAAIDEDQNFRDLGFDSLTAVEVRNRLKIVTGIPLSATLLFDYPTPVALAEYLRVAVQAGIATAPVGLDSALREMERYLDARPTDDSAGAIVRRLEELLLRHREATTGDDVATTEMDVESASQDELLKFIDNELRNS